MMCKAKTKGSDMELGMPGVSRPLGEFSPVG